MEPTDYIKLLSRWGHILPAVILVGGSIFMQTTLIPALKDSDDANDVKGKIKRTWAKVIMICAGIIIISGFYNAYIAFKGDPKPTPVYHAAFTAKLILVGIVFYVSSLLSGRSEVAIKFQEQEAKWGKINMMAAILVVLFAGLMNVAPRVAGDTPNSDNSSNSTLMAPETTTVDINSTDKG